jgi:hypothetical protein
MTSACGSNSGAKHGLLLRDQSLALPFGLITAIARKPSKLVSKNQSRLLNGSSATEAVIGSMNSGEGLFTAVDQIIATGDTPKIR